MMAPGIALKTGKLACLVRCYDGKRAINPKNPSRKEFCEWKAGYPVVDGVEQCFGIAKTGEERENDFECASGRRTIDSSTGAGVCGHPLCFPGRETVHVKGPGLVQMKDLHIGGMIQVGSDKYDPIYSFGHHIPDAKVEYAFISAQGLESPLCVSWYHLLLVEGNMVTASMIAVGDKLTLVDEDKPKLPMLILPSKRVYMLPFPNLEELQ